MSAKFKDVIVLNSPNKYIHLFLAEKICYMHGTNLDADYLDEETYLAFGKWGMFYPGSRNKDSHSEQYCSWLPFKEFIKELNLRRIKENLPILE